MWMSVSWRPMTAILELRVSILQVTVLAVWWQCVAVFCSVLRCVAVCRSVLQCLAVWARGGPYYHPLALCLNTPFHCVGSVLQCGTVCCSVLQCVAVCCSVLQSVAVWSHGGS